MAELYGISKVCFDSPSDRYSCERGEPLEAKSFAKYGFEAFPTVLFMPSACLLFELFNTSFIMPYCLHLNPEHYERKDGEQKRLKHETHQ